MTLQPFRIDLPDSVLEDLKTRLARTRWPDEIPGAGWDYGSNLGYIKELVEYWRTSYDWRAQERMLNSFAQFTTQIDGLGVHFVHEKGQGPDPLPLIILHGWPGSFWEMYKVIGPLADPASHGGDAADAFDVIVPSLPGYGFSDRPATKGVNGARIGEMLNTLMTGALGHSRYFLQGGDWGAIIGTRMAYAFPQNVVGFHLNLVLDQSPPPPEERQSPEEKAWRKRLAAYQREEMGYGRIQGTKPQTLAYGLNDSPAGLAAWIVEKFRTWSDCGGDIESVYTKDELLTNIMLYWVTETINSSTRLYYEGGHGERLVPAGERPKPPMGALAFQKHASTTIREVAERSFNVQRWTQISKGLHFGTLEAPLEMVEDIRGFFRPLRVQV